MATSNDERDSKLEGQKPGQTQLIYDDFTSTLTGSLRGNASHDTGNDWIQLTPASNNQNGEVYWDLPQLPWANFDVYAEVFADNGDGADAVFLYIGSSTNTLDEDTANGGYTLALDEYNGDEIQLNYNGSRLQTISSATHGLGSLDDGTWRRIRFQKRGTAIRVKVWDASEPEPQEWMIDYTDSARTWTDAKKYIGVGARTGGLNNEHRVRLVEFYVDGAFRRARLSGASAANSTSDRSATTKGKRTTPIIFHDNFYVDNVGALYDTNFGGTGEYALDLTDQHLILRNRVGSWQDAVVKTKESFTDFEFKVKVKYKSNTQVVFRSGVSTGSGYGIQLRADAGGEVRLENWGASNLGTDGGGRGWVTGDWYWVRVRVIGNVIKARAWADGASEPSSWDIDYTDTANGGAGLHTSGGIGFGCEGSTGDWDFDSLEIYNFNERLATLTGKASTFSSRGARIPGGGSTDDNDERSAILTGKDTDSQNRGGKITGKDTSSENRSATLLGTETDSDSRGAIVEGKDTDEDTRSLVIVGKQEQNSSRSSTTVGKDTESETRGAHLVGEDTTAEARSATMVGVTDNADIRSAKIVGKDTSVESRSIVTTGKQLVDSGRSVKTNGVDVISSSRGGHVVGQDTDFYSILARLRGEAIDSDIRNLKVSGVSTFADEVLLRLTGKEDVVESRLLKLAGGLSTSSYRGCKITGKVNRGRPTILPEAFAGTILGEGGSTTPIPGRTPTII